MENKNINIDNPYLFSIVKAMQEFLMEEMKGYISSELRLMNKIEAARKLFPEEKRILAEQYKAETTNPTSGGIF